MLIVRRRRIDSSIDLTPLIDVVFQLLIFLMVSSQFTKPEAVVTLPQAPGPASAPEREVISLVLLQDGEVLVNDEAVEMSMLGGRIAETVRITGVTRAEIRGDRSASYGAFVEVMEAARQNGVTSLGVVKKKGQAMEPARSEDP